MRFYRDEDEIISRMNDQTANWDIDKCIEIVERGTPPGMEDFVVLVRELGGDFTKLADMSDGMATTYVLLLLARKKVAL